LGIEVIGEPQAKGFLGIMLRTVWRRKELALKVGKGVRGGFGEVLGTSASAAMPGKEPIRGAQEGGAGAAGAKRSQHIGGRVA